MTTPYNLPEKKRGSFDRWRGEITPQMQALMDAIGAALDRKVFYNTDMNLAIAPLFDWGDAPPMPADGREGGPISYEIYSARQRLQSQRDQAAELATFNGLALVPGQNIGTVKMSALARIKKLCNATVEKAEPGAIVLNGTAGGRRFKATMSATSLARGIERAKPPVPAPSVGALL